MELYKEILIHILSKERAEVTFPELFISAERIVQMTCYQALEKIKAVIQDDTLEDEECFQRIEEIVCIFEKMGSGGGGRHDFI